MYFIYIVTLMRILFDDDVIPYCFKPNVHYVPISYNESAMSYFLNLDNLFT